jgi:hypothetical protein
VFLNGLFLSLTFYFLKLYSICCKLFYAFCNVSFLGLLDTNLAILFCSGLFIAFCFPNSKARLLRFNFSFLILHSI